eukprot:g6509.t1
MLVVLWTDLCPEVLVEELVSGLDEPALVQEEVLSHAKHDRFTQPAKIFKRAPPAFRVKIPPAQPEGASPITVYGILDPLSTTAQSASAALALFGMAFNAEVNLVLNPPMQVEEYPLKRYYREVVRWPERLADGRLLAEVAQEANQQVGRGLAEFTLATQHTLTAAVHALPTWLVTAHEALHDMDNLRPVDVLSKGGHCQTTYALRQLYVEGQAMILGAQGWPIATAKGMQFEITGKGALEASDDTIVMGNLGYFQEISWQLSSVLNLSSGALEMAVFHIVLQEVPCSLLQMVLLRKSLRPRLLLVSVVPLLATLPLGTLLLVRFGHSLFAKQVLGGFFLALAGFNVWKECLVVWRSLGNALRLAMLPAQGLMLGFHDWQAADWPIYLALMMGGLTGLLAGNRLAERVDAKAFHRWLLLFLVAGGLLMLTSGSPRLSQWSAAFVVLSALLMLTAASQQGTQSQLICTASIEIPDKGLSSCVQSELLSKECEVKSVPSGHILNV